jgi:hypothetical protein
MNNNTERNIIVGMFGFLLIAVALMVSTPTVQAFEWCEWIPFWECDNPIILTDHTNYNTSTNTCSGERFNFGVGVYPCLVEDVDGKNIRQYVNFSYNGGVARNGTMVFIYPGEIESGTIEVLRNVTEDYEVGIEGSVWQTNILYDLVGFTNLGSPVEGQCDYGNTNNTKMWAIENSSGDIANYCFTSQTQLDPTTLQINGNVDGTVFVTQQRQVTKWVDVSHLITYLGSNLNNQGYSYYETSQQRFNPGVHFQTRWTYTPRNADLRGKWSILAYQSELGLMNSIENDLYLFIDPWWNNSWLYKQELTGLTGEYPSFNITYDADMQTDFEDLRFLDNLETTELNFTLREKVNSQWAYVTVDTNNASNIYMYYGNAGATATNNTNDTFLYPLSYYSYDGGSVADLTGGNALTNQGATSSSGAVLGAYSYTTNDYMTRVNTGLTGTQARTFIMKVYPDDFSAYYDFLTYGTESNSQWFHWRTQITSGDMWWQYQNGDVTGNTSLTSGQWQTIAYRFDGTNEVTLYLDGVEIAQSTAFGSLSTGTTYDMYFGTYRNIAEWYKGDFDEIMLFDESLTHHQIIELSSMENQSATFGTKESVTSINVVLNSPTNGYKDTTGSVLFNCTCQEASGCTAVNMTFDGVVVAEATNSTPTSNITLTYTNNSIPDGSYTWYCTGEQSGTFANSSVYTLDVDQTKPSLLVYSPVTNYGTLYGGDSIDLNYSATDANRDTCWYQYNLVNTTLNCSTNSTFTYVGGANNITVYVNDTFGNINSSYVAWTVDLTENSRGFVNETLEGSTNLFWVYVTTSNSLTASDFVYNGTSYSANVDELSTNNYNVSYTLTAPNVDVDTNLTFYWTLEISGGSPANLSSDVQLVKPVNFDNCSSYTTVLLNLTHVDEESQALLNYSATNGSLQFDLQMYPLGSTVSIINYSVNSTQNYASFCIDQPLITTSYRYDLQVLYGSDTHVYEKYYIVNGTFDNSTAPNEITLYDLLETDATEFLITVRDSAFNLLDNAIIEVNRKYVSEGVFKTVERPLTDENGNAVAHFDTQKGIYTINVIKDGSVVGSFSDVAVICQDVIIGDCDLNINLVGSTIDNTDYTQYDDVELTWSFDEDTREVQVTFSNTDSASSTMILEVIKYDAFENTTVCNDTLQSVSGTISCTVPQVYGNTSIIAQVYKAGDYVTQRIYVLSTDLSDELGNDVYIFLLILLLTIPMMFISSTVMFVVGTIIGFFIASSLLIFNLDNVTSTASAVLWLMVTGGIIIWKITRTEV